MLQMVDRGAFLAQQLIENQRQVDLLLLDQSRLAAEFVQTDFWDWEGSATPYDWIRINCHLTSNTVSDRVSVGERMSELPQSVQAVQERQIGFAHLAVMARTADAVGKAFDETKLLPLAREYSPGKFHYKCLHYRHSVDAQAYAQEQEEQAQHNRIDLSTGEDGCLLLNGVLDPVGGAAVRTALEPLARKSGEHDDRLLPQRYGDALVELASGGRPANIQVTATIETLKGLAGAAGAEMEFSLPISSASLQRMACDCSVTRVLLSQESVVVDIGRSRRMITGPARKALNARDGHCRWPGCERPASWCDGHHIVHWIEGGTNEPNNLVLLCRRHHRMVHEGGWQLVKCDDGQIITLAPTITFGLPRGPD